MERFKEALKKVFVLPPLPTVLISVPSFVLVFSLLAANQHGTLSYISYALSAYSLVILSTGLPSIVRTFRRRIREHPLMKKPLVRLYFTEPLFRVKLSLYSGLLINLAYILVKMVTGIYYRSLWLIALAGYYILLAVTRLFLASYGFKHTFGKNIVHELRRCRLVGIVLLVMNQSLMVIVVLVVRQNRGFEYPGLLIYAMALYAFYSVTVAIINIVKSRQNGSPAASAARAINLVAALVSMLSLTTAMLAQFGDGNARFRQVMTGAVGGGVCTLVLCIAAFMIWESTKQLKKLRSNKPQV